MIPITIPPELLPKIQAISSDLEIGGRSQIRGKDRASTLASDQLIGQLGEAALSIFLTGNPYWYLMTRRLKAKDKYSGDNGCDLIGALIDIKTSRASKGIYYPYHLWVREREYHPEVDYVLGLVGDDLSTVYLAGYEHGYNVLPGSGDRRSLAMSELKPMKKYLTKEKQLELLGKQLEVCYANGFINLAELVQEQIDKLNG